MSITISLWIIAVIVTIIAPLAAALPLVLAGIFGILESMNIIYPFGAYFYGLPLSVIIGILAGIAAVVTGGSFFAAYLIGPAVLLAIGWGIFAMDIFLYVILGHREPTPP